MKFRMIGCSHHRTPVQLREKIAFMPNQVEAALRALRAKYADAEFALLSTCNRVELYAAATHDSDLPTVEQLRDFVFDFHALPSEEYLSHVVGCADERAVEHLFTVACSLDSLVVGESQILSQVKDAYEAARHINTAGPIVHAVFQRASHVAKRVANETEVHSKRVSIPSVAISEVAGDFFEHFDDKRILVIGSGEMGTETLRYLQAAGAKQVRLINRSFEHACTLAGELNIDFAGSLNLEAVAWEHLYGELREADLIVSTTSATVPIVTEVVYREILAKRRKQSAQLILDLAVPRDFETTIGELPNVYVYSVDDLQAVCERNMSFRQKQFPKAKAIIAEETTRFISDSNFWHTAPTIKALRELSDSIKSTELTRLTNRLAQHKVPPEVEAEISLSMDRLVNKLLNTPLQSLRQETERGNGSDLVLALRRLFQIEQKE